MVPSEVVISPNSEHNILLANDISQVASEEGDSFEQKSKDKVSEEKDPMGFSDVSSVKKSTHSMFTQRQADKSYSKNIRNLRLKGQLQKKPK